METVRAINTNVNPAISEVTRWLAQKSECGDIPESSARLSITSLQALASNLDPSEPKDDAVWMQQNLELLAKRWSTKNTDAKAETVRSYLTRAKGALERYFAWRADPAGYKFDRVVRRSPSKETAETKATVAAAAAAPPPPPPPTQSSIHAHRFRVGPDRYVEFTLPDDNLTVQEWKRLCIHTLTLCDDYNPDEPPPTLSLSITR
jgi:hypothetical protein